MLWKNKTQKVYSDVFVRITTPKEIIEGVGFESDQNLTNYKIYQVSGVFDK
ncbi:MAG: LPS export ABC transporter periplasmic protein LptC [Ignavibacteria bacterium]|nr:LPS export ABC transporter periplasmic protein LptC [Ignavibacteria bacterium]